jgi:alpha,alpha-trehalose-phosphate synthase [UDP-forming]
MVANTLPVRRVKRQGEEAWETSPGGLVSALVPITREARGAWVGWTGERDSQAEPFVHDGISNIPVPISSSEYADFYEGACNRTLWPLYHQAVLPPEYHRHWWRSYVRVNQRFAEAAANAAAEGAVVWVHDYHLQLVPAMLRAKRPDLKLGFFLHTPCPSPDLLVRLPWREKVLDGILSADVVGLQTRTCVGNLLESARRHNVLAASGFDRRGGNGGHLKYRGRTVRIDAFPISIEFDRFDSVARDPAVGERAAHFHKTLGAGRKVMLGVDRLDYTKGIDLRLKSYQELLRSGVSTVRESVLVQVAVPSRERIKEYRTLRRQVEELVGQINGQHGEVGVAAVHYLRRNLPFEELIAMYRSADVMLVTPLADGMNLVAKEFVATRVDDSGVLVLSEFAGAAAELSSAILVNPYDVDGVAEGMKRALEMMKRALEMAPDEAARRMHAMRDVIRRHTVHDWARGFLAELRGETVVAAH